MSLRMGALRLGLPRSSCKPKRREAGSSSIQFVELTASVAVGGLCRRLNSTKTPITSAASAMRIAATNPRLDPDVLVGGDETFVVWMGGTGVFAVSGVVVVLGVVVVGVVSVATAIGCPLTSVDFTLSPAAFTAVN